MKAIQKKLALSPLFALADPFCASQASMALRWNYLAHRPLELDGFFRTEVKLICCRVCCQFMTRFYIWHDSSSGVSHPLCEDCHLELQARLTDLGRLLAPN